MIRKNKSTESLLRFYSFVIRVSTFSNFQYTVISRTSLRIWIGTIDNFITQPFIQNREHFKKDDPKLIWHFSTISRDQFLCAKNSPNVTHKCKSPIFVKKKNVLVKTCKITYLNFHILTSNLPKNSQFQSKFK